MKWQSGRPRSPGKAPAASTPLAVGSHANATCGKCKAITSHIVLAKIGAKPTRVECRTCSAQHAYRMPSSSARAKRDLGEAAATFATPGEAWAHSMRRAHGEAIRYSTSGHYVVGARLNHASFGEGVVARLSSVTVCEVVFATGTVKLVMGKTPA